jgi:polyferredoxin
VPYQALADVVLVLHFAVVLFVGGGLALIVLGNVARWRWVNVWWFRAAHVGAIALVVAEAWIGATCPLTTLEDWLRRRAGAAPSTYHAGFVEHWVQRLLYYEAPTWVFVLGYSLFGLLVAAAWWAFPPRCRGRRDASDAWPATDRNRCE